MLLAPLPADIVDMPSMQRCERGKCGFRAQAVMIDGTSLHVTSSPLEAQRNVACYLKQCLSAAAAPT
jgi:hypothetical protein